MKYNVTINETLARTLQVEADSPKDAESAVNRLYLNSGIILSADDYVSTEIAVDRSQPYYKSPSHDFTLIQGDCNGGISCQSGKVVCVDKGDWDKTRTPQEMDAFNLRWLTSVRSHMKDNATIWISGTYHNIFSVQQQLVRLGFKILNVVTWAKTNPPPNISCRYFTYSTEFIIWARKSAKVPHYFNNDLMKRLNGDKQMTDVWHLPAIARWEKSCGKHPTQKPLGLLARIIEASTKPDAWILDPFSGSSTTGIAANLLGRKFLGLEIEDEYLAMSKARREEIERADVRTDYLRRLAKSGSILPPDDLFAAEPQQDYGKIPWLEEG